MGYEMTGPCIGSFNKPSEPRRINKLEIIKVSNGYTVNGYNFPTMVFLTIDEALAVMKKELN